MRFVSDDYSVPTMEPLAAEAAEGTAKPRTWNWWPWLLLGLLAWQGWASWCLLGKEALLNNQPILSGSYAQHYYLGRLGALALQVCGRSCCIDIAFQAAYPKTPVFNGSRMAEVFLFLGGGTYQPMAYKIGLFAMCMLVPWLIVVGARGVGLDWPATILATTAGLMVWWSPFSYEALEAGHSELLLGSLAVLAHTGLLVSFHRSPGVLSWLGLIVVGWLAWFTQPMLFPIALALFLVYYIHVGHRHASLFWHVFLLLAEALALALNFTWIIDWVMFWWLRRPMPTGSGFLHHRTIETIWNASIWGSPIDRTMGLFLLLSAAIGLLMQPRGQRTASRLLGLGTGGLFLLALLGISWEPLGELGTAGLLAPALWFAALPAAHFWVRASRFLAAKLGAVRVGLTFAILAGVLFGLTFDRLGPLAHRFFGCEPLQYTLGPQREALVETIKSRTTTDARILWEDMPRPRTTPHWTPLLPLLTDRSFVGGLDPGQTFFHAAIGLADKVLQEEPITDCSDATLEQYCTRYNIGWVICFAPDTIKRFEAWSQTEKLAAVQDGDVPGVLFKIKRASLSFALQGHAQIKHADNRYIELADVRPENGVVVLSLHYQDGMRASPSRVQVDRKPDPVDPIGFLRLTMTGPAARVTLTWNE